MSQITTIFRLPTMTQEKYDLVIADLEKAGLGKVQARTAHIMSLTDPGCVIVDVWSSKEDLEKFLETCGPIMANNGVTPEEPEVYPFYNSVD